jgi:hypothetical protein
MPDMDVAELLAQRFDTYNSEVKTAITGTKEAMSGIDARMDAIEQKMARRGGSADFGAREYKSVGQQVAEDEAVERQRQRRKPCCSRPSNRNHQPPASDAAHQGFVGSRKDTKQPDPL